MAKEISMLFFSAPAIILCFSWSSFNICMQGYYLKISLTNHVRPLSLCKDMYNTRSRYIYIWTLNVYKYIIIMLQFIHKTADIFNNKMRIRRARVKACMYLSLYTQRLRARDKSAKHDNIHIVYISFFSPKLFAIRYIRLFNCRQTTATSTFLPSTEQKIRLLYYVYIYCTFTLYSILCTRIHFSAWHKTFFPTLLFCFLDASIKHRSM